MRNSSSMAEGDYMYYNKVKREQIQTGKCSGRPIQERLTERAKHAKSIRDTNFYRSYLLDEIGYRDKYNWLDACICYGCHPLANTHHSTSLNNNMFGWKATSNNLKHIKDTKKLRNDCAAYLFELCYDLMLSKTSNVSQSPGFESLTEQHCQF